jgi:hypothetical protein
MVARCRLLPAGAAPAIITRQANAKGLTVGFEPIADAT